MTKNLLKSSKLGFLAIFLLLGLPSHSQMMALAQKIKAPSFSNNSTKRALKDVLTELKNHYHADILFESRTIEGISINSKLINKDLSLEQNLDLLLNPLGLKYKKINRTSYTIFVNKDNKLGLYSDERAQETNNLNATFVSNEKMFSLINSVKIDVPIAEIIVKGKVTEAGSKDGIPGVSVLMKGSTNGTITDVNGDFKISVPNQESTLTFSFVGYEPQEVTVGNRNQINIILITDTKALNEVVVIGYGTQSLKDVTGSVATINQNTIKDLPVSSVDQKMIGQVAGVQIQQLSGAPGAGTSIRIRGSGSLGAGNEPLYVIDGMPYSAGLNQDFNPLLLIAPNDIESISILKDASSTAIYGSRGANGVIMITTKKGQYNKLQVTLSSMRGIQQVPLKGRPELMNQQEFIDLQRNKIDIAVRRAENRAATLADYPLEYQNPEKLVGDGTDWYDLLLQTAAIQEHTVSMQKGTQESRLNFSLGYYNQKGVLKYTGVERYNAKLGIESNISKSLTLGVSLQPTFINQKRTNTNSNREDVIGVANWANPVVSPYDADGNLIPYLVSPQSKYHSAWSFANPLFVLKETSQSQNQFQSLGSAYLEWEILPDLKARTSLNTIWSTSKFNQYIPSTVGASNAKPLPGTGRATKSNSDNFNWLIENTLTYNKTFEKHRINILGGYTTQKSTTNFTNFNAGPFSNDLIQTINAAQAITTWGENVETWSIISYLGRVNYSFNEKYLLTGTFRTDGSSRFGIKNRYANFPSVAAAWRVSEEDFLKNNKVINNLKLRASYGTSGNNNIGNYSHLAAIRPGSYVFGTNQVSASFVGLSNPYLTWEESNQFDAGIDVEFFNNRFSLVLDYYNRVSKNMLLNDVIPGITGFNSQVVNKGNVRNRGVEISLGGSPISGPISWDFNLNFAINRNLVLSLNENGDRVLSGNNDNNPTHVTVVGKPIGQFFGFISDGVYTAADIADPKIIKSAQVYEGNSKYRDVNGDGVINDFLDYTIIGSPHPKFIFGFSNNFSYKKITLGIILNGQYGGQVMNGLRQTTDNLQGFFNVSKEFVNRWRSPDNPGDGTLYGVPKLTPSWGHRVNSRWVEDASFLRVSNISLGYTLPEKIVRKTNIVNSCRFYLTVRNAGLLTKYKGANPEAQSRNIDNTLSPGFDMSSYPLARTSSIGVNLTF